MQILVFCFFLPRRLRRCDESLSVPARRYNAFMDLIYLDNNATTPLLPAVAEAMRPFATEVYGNPASAHAFGRRARRALEDARDTVAELLDAAADEVIFTSGATEANNLALLGRAGCRRHRVSDRTPKILASPVEHPSVAGPLEQLAELGHSVGRLPVDTAGIVHPETLANQLCADTHLVTVQLANHETGSVQPVRELAALAAQHAPGCSFHCDAAQAAGKMPVRFHELGVATLSLSAHKFHGPKGVGALLVRRGMRFEPLLFGGHQQQGRRPGTEPVALAVGLATALAIAQREMGERREHVGRLRALLLARLCAEAAPVVVNGMEEGGLPHTLNLSFPGCRAESLLMNLDLAGVACSTGSACSSGSLLPSPVLQAMGASPERLHSAMRFSLSPLLAEAEVAEAARRIVVVVCRLRQCAGAMAMP
jgi:cysteine desulfurase